MTTPKIEIGFDLTATGSGPFFILDDPVRGLLDQPPIIEGYFVLAGELYYDVTTEVRSVTVQRGKNRILDEFEAGLANIVFDNRNRSFDPQNINSPYATQIIPKRKVKITVDNKPVFFGLIDDWNFDYDISGDSTSSAAASDAITGFSNTSLPAGTSVTQLSGARINAILTAPTVNWPLSAANIDPGAMILGPDIIEEGTNALQYLRTIEKSEPGLFFVAKDGFVTFRDRNVAPTSNTLTFADDGTGIKYGNLKVQYGSELLANEVIVNSVITGSTAIAIDQESQSIYGNFTLSQSDLLINTDLDLANLAVFWAAKYSAPEYRFESLDVTLNNLTQQEIDDILDLELGSPVAIKFTPNGVGSPIFKYAQVIRIHHFIDTVLHVVSLGFTTLDFSLLVPDDPVFGKLDAGHVLNL